MGNKDRTLNDRAETTRGHAVQAPPAHAGIVSALTACFAKPPVLPEEFRRLLDRLH
jgi:hypothetical protein